jgi:hypothetical protein
VKPVVRVIKSIAILIAIVVTATVIWQRLVDPKIPLRELTRSIEQEIPAGSTTVRVSELLEARHFVFSGYNVGPDPLYGLSNERRERKRYITARLPVRSAVPYFGDYDIHIVFYFDEKELLSEYRLQQLSDGP